MNQIDFQTIITALGTAGTCIGGVYVGIKRFINARKKEEKLRDSSILQQAKDCDQIIKHDLEDKVSKLKENLKDQKETLENEIKYLKELHNSELKYLGEKIETLRIEVQNQHLQLMQILTQLINKD